MLEQLVISIQIILIDIVMAADNAIIIGLIAANFAPQNKKKIIASWRTMVGRTPTFPSQRSRSDARPDVETNSPRCGYLFQFFLPNPNFP